MDASAGNTICIKLQIPPFGCFELEAADTLPLGKIAADILAGLGLQADNACFFHVETGRFLMGEESLLTSMVFEKEELILLGLPKTL